MRLMCRRCNGEGKHIGNGFMWEECKECEKGYVEDLPKAEKVVKKKRGKKDE